MKSLFQLSLFILSIISPSLLFSQRLIPLVAEGRSISEGQQGPNSGVYSMVEYNEKILCSGRFTDINGDEAMNKIAYWNGSEFEPFETLLDSSSTSDVLFKMLDTPLGLVACGKYDYMNHIIVHDGSSWQTIGEGFDHWVYDIAWFDNQLYAAGRFENSGTSTTSRIAKWDGNNWQAVDTGMNDRVFDLEVYNNQLYAVGTFTQAGDQDCARIARLNSGVWESVGAGFDEMAMCMKVIEDELYIGGYFATDAYGNEYYYGLCKFNGTAFSQAHNGAEQFYCGAIVQIGDDIFVSEFEGGGFNSFLRMGRSKKLVDFSLIGFDDDLFTVHGAIEYQGKTVVSSTEVDLVTPEEYFYLNNGLFEYLPNGNLSTFIRSSEIRGLVFPSAALFLSPKTTSASYIVQEDPYPVSTIYSTAPWISATLENDTTLLANVQQYHRAENSAPSFKIGPFSNSNDQEFLRRYLRVWELNRDQVNTHISFYYNPNYQVPEAITNWPANGRVEHGEHSHLAPFEDLNENGIYEPESGEYPVIRGDRCVYYILKTDLDDTEEFDTNLEIGVMLYTFDELPSTVFVNYQVRNNSTNNYSEVKFGMWSDGDIGTSIDDYIGSSPENNFYFFYNADEMDESSSSSYGFGSEIPMQAISFLERNMSHFLYYNNGLNSVNGEPTTPHHHHNYLSGIWKNGTPVLFGGDGAYPATGADPNTPTDFMFPSDPNLLDGEGIWNEQTVGSSGGDRRGIGSFEGIPILAGETANFDLAFVTAFPENEDELVAENFDNLVSQNAATQSFYAAQNFIAPDLFPMNIGEDDLNLSALKVYPNPSKGTFKVTNSEKQIQKLHISNLQGELVFSNESRSNEYLLEISELPSGVYLLRVFYELANPETLRLVLE